MSITKSALRKRKANENADRRRARVFELVMIDGREDSREIAQILLAEKVLASKSAASALRLVQADLKLLRDTTEAKRYVERRLDALRRFRTIANDASEVSYDVVTPKGDTVTVSKPRWPAGVRVRALHYYTLEAEAIARVAGIDVSGKRKAKSDGDQKKQPFRGVVPVDLSELPEADREAVTKAMKSHPGAGGGEEGGVPN